jgi:hypothetical protein
MTNTFQQPVLVTTITDCVPAQTYARWKKGMCEAMSSPSRNFESAQSMSPAREACILAHSLNNQLTVILGHCEMALDEHLEDPICKVHILAIRAAANGMAAEVSRYRHSLCQRHSQ